MRKAQHTESPGRMLTLMPGVLMGTGVALVLSICTTVQAQSQQRGPQFETTRLETGKRAYETHCANCHGVGGVGDGPMKPYLTTAPSDLTTIAKRNGGTFPEQLVWEMIDGRSTVSIGPHGSREMPIWGQEFREQARRSGDQKPEWSTRNRIVALLTYLERIQQK